MTENARTICWINDFKIPTKHPIFIGGLLLIPHTPEHEFCALSGLRSGSTIRIHDPDLNPDHPDLHESFTIGVSRAKEQFFFIQSFRR